ncbi:Na+/H+ antiporter NhaC family protein [Ferrimonas pelagia]|uniref:Na+/H+ antiporter NhaC-like C-terminal domain-containing protein n=1 Tax=Ferrimonas pelagia TaxID=1177826 RepID=A0ABP9EI44_9GAMM
MLVGYPAGSSARSARLAVVGVGFLVFIDGIFSCLANGHISRPIVQRYGVPPTQLAYLVDSTASPLCAILPISSWGPYVMTLLAGIPLLTMLPAAAFVEVASANFYAFAALAMALAAAYWGWGFEPVAARQTEVETAGSPWPLLLPLLVLILGSIVLSWLSGWHRSGEVGLLACFASADIGAAMRNACLMALLMALASARALGLRRILQALWQGLQAVAPALGILLLTWMIGRSIDDLGSGELLARWASAYLPVALVLPGLFVLCAVTAFATGSSWGTFALMIPIGAAVASGFSPALILPAVSAVMAGSVFGDHCSPISDTTVISAGASGCEPMQLVLTQLPLAWGAAGAALLGFTLLGLGLPLLWCWLVLLCGGALAVLGCQFWSSRAIRTL